MPNIEEIAMSNYQSNMQYFRANHSSLYSKLQALETLLEAGKYPQKYNLEYKDNYFDVIELASQNTLYNQNSEIYSNKLNENISFKKSAQVIETFYNYQFSKKAVEKLKESDPLTMHATTAEIIDYHNLNIKPSMSMNTIVKFIFIGVGLGLHIPKIIKKTKSTVLLIIEDDIELFRLSLFTSNYENSMKNCHTYFAIAQNSVELSDTFTNFYLDSFVRNHYLKFSLFSSHYDKKIKELQTLVLSRPEIGYPHEYLLYKNIKVLEKLKKNYKFLDLSKKEDENFFFNKPILVLGAGPSLHSNIEWIKKNSDKFIIIAAFAVLKTLYKINISPDIVVQIDEKVKETHLLMSSFNNFDFLKYTVFIFSASVPDILFETFDRENIYLLEDRTQYKLNNTRLISASVGESAYAISLIFNTKNIYLLGIDLALADDGSSHTKDHHLGSNIDTSTANEIQKSASMDDTVTLIKGNFKEEVASIPRFMISIPILNNFTKNMKSKNQTVYNLSDGAYFENTTPLKIKNCNLSTTVDKSTLEADLRTLFNNYSSQSLSDTELNNLNTKLIQVKNWRKLLNTFQNDASSNKNIFIQNYNTLLQEILNSKRDELYELIIIYFLNSASYVTDFFDTKELENPKKHTKKMKKIVIHSIEKILNLYESSLIKTIEE